MTDQDDNIRLSMKITVQDFDDFYRDKGATEACPFCAKTDWSLVGDAQAPEDDLPIRTITPELLTLDNTRTGKGISMIPMACINCGNMRFQNLQVFLNWKKDKVGG